MLQLPLNIEQQLARDLGMLCTIPGRGERRLVLGFVRAARSQR